MLKSMANKKQREITEEIKQKLRKKAEILLKQHNVGGEGGGVDGRQRLEELYAEGYEVLEETKSNVPYLRWDDGKMGIKKEFPVQIKNGKAMIVSLVPKNKPPKSLTNESAFYYSI